MHESLKSKVAKLKANFKGSISSFGDDPEFFENVPCLTTGVLALDNILGRGKGFPEGRIVEVYGPEGTGKTTLCLTHAAQVQRSKKNASIMFVDMEHSLDLTYAASIGLDIDNVVLALPESGEEALDIIKAALKFEFDLIIVDSVAAMVPMAELNSDASDAAMAAHPRLMSKFMRDVTTIMGSCTLLLTNQIRSKVGVIFGSPEVTTGGNAIKFFATQRIDMRVIERKETYNRVKFKIVKNKLGAPYKECEATLYFGQGFSRAAQIIDVGPNTDVVEKKSSYYIVGDIKQNGFDNAVTAISQLPAEEIDKLYDMIRSSL